MGIVYSKLVTIGNRLLTVAMLIACQEMPESNNFNNFGNIEVEQPGK